MARRLYHGPGPILCRDGVHDRGVQNPPLPEQPAWREHLSSGAQKPENTPLFGGRYVEWLVVREVDPHRRVTAQVSGHLPRLRNGGPQNAPAMRPLQGEVLEDQEPHLVT